MSTAKHDQFQYILQLLMLAITINYGHAMLPDSTCKSKFNNLEEPEMEYTQPPWCSECTHWCIICHCEPGKCLFFICLVQETLIS
jgi:hypothetical protein